MNQFINPFTISVIGSILAINRKAIGKGITGIIKDIDKEVKSEKERENLMTLYLHSSDPFKKIEAERYFDLKRMQRLENSVFIMRLNNLRTQAAYGQQVDEMYKTFQKWNDETRKEINHMKIQLNRRI